MTTPLTLDMIRQAPKALLHDHLDGGLRPATVVELAEQFGYDGLPTTDPDDLAVWFRRGADRQSLELYLETFQQTVGVLQDRDAISRVSAECAEDQVVLMVGRDVLGIGRVLLLGRDDDEQAVQSLHDVQLRVDVAVVP